MESVISGSSTLLQGGSTTNLYDANNNLIGVRDSTKAANNRDFINDVAGHILQGSQNGNVQRQLVVNGEVLGRHGSYLNPDKPADSSGNPLFTSGASFNFGFTKVSGSYPATQPGTRTVAAGESLQSIAKATYGDSSLWYLIADANGLGGDRDLRVGQTLNVPSRVTGAKNNSTTFKPYNPGEVVGNTTPNLPAPPGGGGGGGCGGLGMIIMIVVVVVATIYTAGAAAAYFAGSTAVVGGTAASVAAGGLAGTMSVGAAALSGSLGLSAGMAMGVSALAYGVGNLAGQIAGNAMGMQSGINWTSVATSAIGGAVTAGMGGGASGSSEFSWSNAASAMGRAAVGNAMTQTVSVALGLQKEFNWNQVAMTAVTAGVGYGLNKALSSADVGAQSVKTDGLDRFAQNFGRGLISNTVMTLARGGRVDAEQIMTDAFGNALGSSLANAMQPEPAAGSGLRLGAGSGLGLRATDSAMAAFDRALDERIANRVWAMQEAEAYDRGDYVPGGGDPDAELPGMGAGPRAPRTYTVRPGDNPARIGRMFYGDERAGATILADNGLDASVKGARNLQPGTVLTLRDDINAQNLRAGGTLIAMDTRLRSDAAARANNPNYGNEGRGFTQPLSATPQLAERPVYTAMGDYVGTEMVPVDTQPVRDPVGETLVRTAKAAWNDPAQTGIGVAKSVGNIGPGLVNAAVIAPKLAVEGYLTIGNAAGWVSDATYQNFRDVQPLQMHTWEPANDAQRFGQYGTDALMAIGGGVSAWSQAGKVGLLREAISVSGYLDVATPANRAIVWSNMRGGNLAAADTYIAHNPGYIRLEMTPGGRYLESLNLFERFDYEVAIKPWEQLSARYAAGASGEVTAFTAGALPKSVFQRIELPILQKNPGVTIRYMSSPKP